MEQTNPETWQMNAAEALDRYKRIIAEIEQLKAQRIPFGQAFSEKNQPLDSYIGGLQLEADTLYEQYNFQTNESSTAGSWPLRMVKAARGLFVRS